MEAYTPDGQLVRIEHSGSGGYLLRVPGRPDQLVQAEEFAETVAQLMGSNPAEPWIAALTGRMERQLNSSFSADMTTALDG